MIEQLKYIESVILVSSLWRRNLMKRARGEEKDEVQLRGHAPRSNLEGALCFL